MNIAENLQRIQDAKADLREAINAKGGELSNDAKIEEFADAVENLPTGEGSPYAVDFGRDIYKGNPQHIQGMNDDIAYYNEVVQSIKSGVRTWDDYINGEFASEFKAKIAFLPSDFPFENKSSYLSGFLNLKEVYSPNTKLFYYPNRYFYGNYKLECVNMDCSKVDEFPSTFTYCTSLTRFVVSAPDITRLQNTFQNCFSLTEVVIDGEKMTNIIQAFANCYSIQRVILNGTITTTSNAFASCTSLQDVEINVAVNTDFSASAVLSHRSIAYILSHASGTITLTFNKTAIAGLSESEEVLDGKTYAQIYVEATQKGITIAEK